MKNGNVYDFESKVSKDGCTVTMTIQRQDRGVILRYERKEIENYIMDFLFKNYLPLLTPFEEEELRYMSHTGKTTLKYSATDNRWKAIRCLISGETKEADLYQEYHNLGGEETYDIEELLSRDSIDKGE